MMKASKTRQQLLRSEKQQFRQLVFVGESAEGDRVASRGFLGNYASLDTVPRGNGVVVEQIYTSKKVCHQLRDLGLRLGTTVRVVSQTPKGSAIVKVNGRHIGLGAEVAQRITVTVKN